MEKDNDIGSLVRACEQNDEQGNTKISEYVDFSLRETLEKIEAYTNSKHTSGSTDSQGREKPFFNIVTSAINIWFRATDIDRKNIRLVATKEKDYIKAFLATILLQSWMKKTGFGVFLNDWGRTLAKYGSAVTKFVEKKGILYTKVVSWNSLIIDPIDFENNVVIEKLWFTPAQLRRQQGYNKQMVEDLIKNTVSRKLIGVPGQSVDTKSGYIPVYEVHGELPRSFLTGEDEDKTDYVQQVHILSFLTKKEDSSGYDDYTLYSGQEVKSPYRIDHLIKEDNRSLAIGAVENLFEAQWMVNHSVKQIKDQLDLASKLLFQTADGNFVGLNALNNIENGDILIHTQGNPLTQISNTPNIQAMLSFQEQWRGIGNQINGISEAMTGQNPPSGTAWRLQQAILQESHSLFELITENKGLAIEGMMRDFIIPYFKKQLDNAEEISAILDEHQIKLIDEIFVPNEAIRRVNKKIKETVLSGQIYDMTQQTGEIALNEQALRKELSLMGSQRFIKPSEIKTKTWKDYLKDLELDLDVEITGENKDTQTLATTLTTVFQTIATNPMILQDPNARMVFNEILNIVGGLSPLKLNTQPVPAMAGVGGRIAQT
jgi:hypothetical protein